MVIRNWLNVTKYFSLSSNIDKIFKYEQHVRHPIRKRISLPVASTCVHPRFFIVSCVVFVLFVIVRRYVSNVTSVSGLFIRDCPFGFLELLSLQYIQCLAAQCCLCLWIVHSVFSNFYLVINTTLRMPISCSIRAWNLHVRLTSH